MHMDKETVSIKHNDEAEQTSLRYTVVISPYMHKRLDRHIFIIKKLIDKKLTKHNWLLDAINEKLKNEAPYEEVPTANTITIKMDHKFEQLILQRIEYIKKFRKSYSKKQWISDAIIDKLERDEEHVEKKLLEARPDHEDGLKGISDKEQIEILKKELAELKAVLGKN